MPCVPVPAPPTPTLPDGITLSAPLPAVVVPSVPTPCCTLPSLPTLPIPKSLGSLVVNAAFVAGVRAVLANAQAYLFNLPLNCPRS